MFSHLSLSFSFNFLLLIIGSVVVVGSPARPRALQPSSYDLPLTWNQFGFLANISFGTPPQQITTFVDWTWISQYVFSTTCHDDPNATYECFSKQQQLFNQSQSSTLLNESTSYPSRTWNPNHFFFYKNLTVDYISDILSIGPTSSRVVIQAADFSFDSTTSPYPLAGVYGLSPVFKSDNSMYPCMMPLQAADPDLLALESTQSPFYQAWTDGGWPEPIVAFHYCYNGSKDTNKSTCGGHDGLQTLGGSKPSLIDGEISWYDVELFPEVNTVDFVYEPALYNYWALKLTQLSLGDKVQGLNKSTGAGAIFDHASYGRGAPLSVNAYQELISMSGATPVTLESSLNNGNQSFYRVDCDKTKTLPPIKYRFAGPKKDWEITPSNYVDDVGNNTCVLNVRTLGDGDMIAGNFGETFAKDKYILFNFEKLKVGIADLRW